MAWSIDPKIIVNGVAYTNLTYGQVIVDFGRFRIFDAPRSGYAKVEILNTTNTVYPFKINDTLVVQIKNGSGVYTTIFSGNVGEIRGSLQPSGSVNGIGTITLTGYGAMSRMSRVVVGLSAYPQETDAARISRIFTEAGVTVDVVDNPIYTFSARSINPTDAYTLSSKYAQSVLGNIYETPDGKIGYANEDRRLSDVNANGYRTIPTGSIIVNSISSQESMTDVINYVNLNYTGGSTSFENASSQTTYGYIDASLTTELVNLADASLIAQTYITMRSVPETSLNTLTVRLNDPTLTNADIDTLLGVYFGMPVTTPDLPNTIIDETYYGFVEGWNLNFSPAVANLTLRTSNSTYSKRGLRWQEVNATARWMDVTATTTWDMVNEAGIP